MKMKTRLAQRLGFILLLAGMSPTSLHASSQQIYLDTLVDFERYADGCWHIAAYLNAPVDGHKFNTFLVGQLIRKFIDNDHVLTSKIGEREFSGQSSGPIYLIPYDDPYIRRYCRRKEEFDLYPGGVPSEGLVRRIVVPMEFDLEIEPHFHYKIEGNLLFKRQKSGWLLTDMEPPDDAESE